MKLRGLAKHYSKVPVSTLVRYIRSLGVVFDGELDETVPDYILPQIEQNFGTKDDELVPYQSVQKTSKYMVWRREIPLIYRDVIEMTERMQFGKILDRRIELLGDVCSRIKTYVSLHPDLRQDGESIINGLASALDQMLAKYQESIDNASEDRDLIWGQIQTIKQTRVVILMEPKEDTPKKKTKNKTAEPIVHIQEPTVIVRKQVIPYASDAADSKYEQWRNDLPLIHKDLIEAFYDALDSKAFHRAYDKLGSLLKRMADHCNAFPECKEDAEFVIAPLLSEVNAMINQYKDTYYNQKGPRKLTFHQWQVAVKIKVLYTQILDSFEEDKIILETTVPWDKVKFYDGYIMVENEGGRPLKFVFLDSKEVYNLFASAFIDRFPPLVVRFHSQQKPEIVNSPDVKAIFKFLKIRDDLRLGRFINPRDYFDFIRKSPIDFSQDFLPRDRSKYIQYLVEHQCPNYRYVTMFEKNLDTEDAFLFTIRGSRKMCIVWENKNDMTATYMFPITEKTYDQALQAIYDYASAADIEQKRLRIHHGVMDGVYGLKCKIINHLDFNQWKNEVTRFLNTQL